MIVLSPVISFTLYTLVEGIEVLAGDAFTEIHAAYAVNAVITLSFVPAPFGAYVSHNLQSIGGDAAVVLGVTIALALINCLGLIGAATGTTALFVVQIALVSLSNALVIGSLTTVVGNVVENQVGESQLYWGIGQMGQAIGLAGYKTWWTIHDWELHAILIALLVALSIAEWRYFDVIARRPGVDSEG